MRVSHLRQAFSRVEGVRLHWATLGRGRPLVLLHGLSDSLRTWLRVAPELSQTRQIFLLDLAGHGRSDRPDASYTLEWHARLVVAWMNALGIEEADVVGHSYGGGIALWMLLEHEERIRRLALVATGGLGRDVGLPLRLASLPQVVERFGQRFMALGTRMALKAAGAAYDADEIAHLAKMNALPGTARAFARTVRDVIDWRGQNRHVFDRAHEIRLLPPMALLWGDRDPVIPMAHALHTASLLDGVLLERFPSCGHFPHHQHPEAFVRAIGRFVDAPELARARLRMQAIGGGAPSGPSEIMTYRAEDGAPTLTRIPAMNPASQLELGHGAGKDGLIRIARRIPVWPLGNRASTRAPAGPPRLGAPPAWSK